MEKLVIDASLAREIHQYISTSPTGNVPFDRVFRLLAQLEALPPLKVAEKDSDTGKQDQKPPLKKR
jgi:hypothetical protein